MPKPEKRQAVIDGALATFGRDGYSRASIDAIAAVAGVSTRTIYNHFGGKAALFETVIAESATRVADVQVGIIEAWEEEANDLATIPERLEGDLVRLCLRIGRSAAQFPDHFALIRQVAVEADHLPPEALAAWRAAGPDRVADARTAAIARLVKQGLLAVDDPAMAARHLALLADREAADHPDDAEALVRAGVRAFLHGYAAI